MPEPLASGIRLRYFASLTTNIQLLPRISHRPSIFDL
jgi:hypothetical protein